jgi:hypothetical protein
MQSKETLKKKGQKNEISFVLRNSGANSQSRPRRVNPMLFERHTRTLTPKNGPTSEGTKKKKKRKKKAHSTFHWHKLLRKLSNTHFDIN